MGMVINGEMNAGHYGAGNLRPENIEVGTKTPAGIRKLGGALFCDRRLQYRIHMPQRRIILRGPS